MEEYRIVWVEPADMLSHDDMAFPKAIYTIVKTSDHSKVKVKLERSRGWKVGDLVWLEDFEIKEAKV